MVYNRAGCRLGTGALADEKHLAYQIALDMDGVIHAVNLSQERVLRNKDRMDSRLDGILILLGYRQEFDSKTQFPRVAEVAAGETRNTFAVNVLRLHLLLKRPRG